MKLRLALALWLASAVPLVAQESALFPRFSVIGAQSASSFETNARIDPDVSGLEGTLVGFERDLGLEAIRGPEAFVRLGF